MSTGKKNKNSPTTTADVKSSSGKKVKKKIKKKIRKTILIANYKETFQKCKLHQLTHSVACPSCPTTTSRFGKIRHIKLRKDGQIYEEETGFLIKPLPKHSSLLNFALELAGPYSRLILKLGNPTYQIQKTRSLWQISRGSLAPNPFFRPEDSKLNTVDIIYDFKTNELAIGVKDELPDADTYLDRPEIQKFVNYIKGISI